MSVTLSYICANFYSFVYVFSISCQLAGAVLLLIENFKSLDKQIYDWYSEKKDTPESYDNGKTFKLDKKIIQGILKTININRFAFFDLVAGYLSTIWAYNSLDKCCTALLVIILTSVIIFFECKLSTYISKKQSNKEIFLPIKLLNGSLFWIIEGRDDKATPTTIDTN